MNLSSAETIFYKRFMNIIMSYLRIRFRPGSKIISFGFNSNVWFFGNNVYLVNNHIKYFTIIKFNRMWIFTVEYIIIAKFTKENINNATFCNWKPIPSIMLYNFAIVFDYKWFLCSRIAEIKTLCVAFTLISLILTSLGSLYFLETTPSTF